MTLADFFQRLPNRPWAWQPFTGRGVAAFAMASPSWVFLYQVVLAGVCSMALVWCLLQTWCPVVDEAVQQLPPSFGLEAGQLVWPNSETRRLGENRFLAIAVDPAGTGGLGQIADVQLTVRASEVEGRSLLGFMRVRLPARFTGTFARVDTIAGWGAWRWVILLSIGLGLCVGLLLSWWMLASAYLIPVRLMAWLSGRELSWGGAFRIGSAALVAGGVVMTGTLLLYASTMIRLPVLLVGFPIHFVVGWVLAFLGAAALAPRGANPSDDHPNPFGRVKSADATSVRKNGKPHRS